MIRTFANTMLALRVAKFLFNDLPHVAGLAKPNISEENDVCSDFWAFWATHGGPAPEVKSAITLAVRGVPFPDDVVEFFSYIPVPPERMIQCVLSEKKRSSAVFPKTVTAYRGIKGPEAKRYIEAALEDTALRADRPEAMSFTLSKRTATNFARPREEYDDPGIIITACISRDDIISSWKTNRELVAEEEIIVVLPYLEVSPDQVELVYYGLRKK